MNNYKTIFFSIGVLLIILGAFMLIPFFVQFIYGEENGSFLPSYIISTKNGISMNAPNIIRSMPIAKKTVLLLFIFDDGGYLKIFEIQHNKTLLYLYFTREI